MIYPPDLEPETDEPWRYLSLSDRVDVHAMLDAVDYEAARSLGSGLWCHTYGSGEMDPETGVISRPDGMYARKTVGGKTIFLHRWVCRRAHGPPPVETWIADHRNGRTLDCRRLNLQWVSKSANAKNIPGSELRARYERETWLAGLEARR